MDIAEYIDFTLLKSDATKEDIEKLCSEAKENNYASVCVNPYYVKSAFEYLFGTNTKVCTVVGFPLGATYTESKVLETQLAIINGAEEIDMVMNIGALKDGEITKVRNDIIAVSQVCKRNNVILKVIIETCLLTQEEKIIASNIIANADADFVKTSTGFSTAGAIIEDIILLKKEVGGKIKIKASGGIKDRETACNMIEAGADRIGTSKML